MLTTLHQAERAADVTRTLTETLTSTVPDGPLMLYRGLHTVAIEAYRQRGYVGAVSSVAVHLPLEVAAKACGVHRVTVWRWAGVLKGLGLIDYRPHKGSLRGQTRNTGCVWLVKMNPAQGKTPRLSYEELSHPWRDLDRDVKRGRTAYRMLRANGATVKSSSLRGVNLVLLLEWALPPKPTETPLNTDRCTRTRVSLEAVLDVPHAEKAERNRVVDLAAQALAEALADAKGRDFYRRLLWQLLRMHDRGLDAPFYPVYLAAVRAQVDVREGFARRGGALFTARVKAAPWFDELWRTPPVRVGSPLLKA